MSTSLVTRAYNLGLKAVPNFVGLTEEQILYYEKNLDQIPAALTRGFTIPSKESEAKRPQTMPPCFFNTADTDINWWLDQAEAFSKKHLGVEVNLRRKFTISTKVPWKSVIPVFDPGLTNRDMVNKALKSQCLTVYEEIDVMNYSGSQANQVPTLDLIENSVQPNEDTISLSPDQLRKTGKTFLPIRSYGLAFGLYYFAKKCYLDSKTWTWFPECRLSDGKVADGYWDPATGKVRFRWDYSSNYGSNGGARVAMPVSLATP